MAALIVFRTGNSLLLIMLMGESVWCYLFSFLFLWFLRKLFLASVNFRFSGYPQIGPKPNLKIKNLKSLFKYQSLFKIVYYLPIALLLYRLLLYCQFFRLTLCGYYPLDSLHRIRMARLKTALNCYICLRFVVQTFKTLNQFKL